MTTCMKCNVVLTADNWQLSWQKTNHRECKSCKSEYNKISNPKTNPKFNPKRMYVNGKYIKKSHPLHKAGKYKTFNDAAFEGTYKIESIKEGYVYIISNRSWPHWVKIGMAIDAEDRLNSYQTSSPYRDYELEHRVFSSDRRASEQEAHTKAAAICIGRANEWFELSVREAIIILDNLNEHGHSGTPTEADTHTEEDNIQGSLF